MADRRAFLHGMVGALPAAMLPSLVSATTSADSKPATKRLAPMEELAAVDFHPLKVGEDFVILSKEEWVRAYDDWYIVASSIAAKMLADTKPQLVVRARKLMEDLEEGEEESSTIYALRTMLSDTETFIKELASPISAAETRLLCACCYVAEHDDGGAHA